MSCLYNIFQIIVWATGINRLMLTTAKSSLSISVNSFRLKHIWGKIQRRNVYRNIIGNSPSNIL